MHFTMFRIVLLISVIVLISGSAYSQQSDKDQETWTIIKKMDKMAADYERSKSKSGAGIQNTGDLSFRRFIRWGKHTGNLVETPFVNNGNVSDGYWSPSQKQRWPIGSGVVYMHTSSFFVASEVQDNAGRTVPIITSAYRRGGGDSHPSGSHQYFFQPVPGYFNMSPQHDNSTDRAHLDAAGKYYVGGISVDTDDDGEPDTELKNTIEYPAMSHLPETWPEFWPPQSYPGDDRSENDIRPGVRAGRWNGQYGALVRADQESFYVMDDRDNDKRNYYPFNLPNGQPDNRPWREGGRRGMGVEVTVRQYQWSNVLAEDIVVSTFDVKNVSEKDIPKMVVGMLVDYDIGDRTGDNRAFYDVVDDITYQWHNEGLSNRGLPSGYGAAAFLQSPGDPFDGIDNDFNGLVDESQQNGIDDDGDWRPWEDINGNGVFDAGIDLIWDDVGSDGLGPEDEDYPGPDPDGSEANGIPDLGEPNFEFTDNDEIDQIGLTSVYISFPSNIQNDLANGEQFFNNMITPGVFVVPEETSDIMYVYGSGFIELQMGRQERFAIATINGNDFDDILRNKRTMRNIYDSDYNFAQAPNRPFLTAIPGDKKVTLLWENSSERSRDPIYGRDFHMYKIYRSSVPSFDDIKTITDAFGNPILWKSIAQFDKKNGLSGAHPIQLGETGVSYDMGKDTGLKYSYVDSNLVNGRTYYYALVAVDTGYDIDFYERGISAIPSLSPISPTETSKIIQVDPLGRPTFIDRNTAVVVPVEPSAGYIQPDLEEGVVRVSGNATGNINVKILNPEEIKSGNTYSITFSDDGRYELIDPIYKTGRTTGMMLRNLSTGDTLYTGNADFQSEAMEATFIDGLKFEIQNDGSPIVSQSGWEANNNRSNAGRRAPINVTINGTDANLNAIPYDFEIRVSEMGADTSFSLVQSRSILTNFTVMDVTDSAFPQKVPFTLVTQNGDPTPGVLKAGDIIELKAEKRQIGQQFIYTKSTWRMNFNPAGAASGFTIQQLAQDYSTQNGDMFYFNSTKPFDRDDEYTFKVTGNAIADDLNDSILNDVYVVPDPYIAASILERRVADQSGRGERRIEFVNLPQVATIKIFTISGRLVQQIEHNSSMDNGRAPWNMITNDGLEAAYGVYVYHINAPGIGEKIGRFAIIK